MAQLKEKMLAADFVFLGSPVYAVNISAQMKTFLDRLPAWMHTMRLAGKPGMTVVTTAGNGMEEAQNYLGMMLVSLGVKCVGKLGTYATLPVRFRDPELAAAEAMAAYEVAYPYVV